jgi:eukaryotic-like serine/threonine-protein kinase
VTEKERLDAVRRYDIRDTPPAGAFDRITAIAARLLNVPIAIVSIVDHHRIWFKSRRGLDLEQVDRELGLCASCILHEGPWIISDAGKDVRALANPLVGQLRVQFYLGVPLRTHDGFNLGTLCVLERPQPDRHHGRDRHRPLIHRAAGATAGHEWLFAAPTHAA